MTILPVLDILRGQAVHARGGNRDHYAPVASVLHEGSNPVDLAVACRDHLSVDALYVADLDAITRRAPNREILRQILRLGMNVMVDAGVRTCRDLEPWLIDGLTSVVAGLETVASPRDLAEIVAQVGSDRVVFSLDLRHGKPLVPTLPTWRSDAPRDLARIAIDQGVRRLILLDLGRVGQGRGVGTEALLRDLRRDHDAIELIAGGGVAGPADLRSLRDAGASAVLVGSAIHDGRITSEMIRQASHPESPASS